MSDKPEHHTHPIHACVIGVTAPILFIIALINTNSLSSYYVNVTKLWIYFPIPQIVFLGVGYLLVKAQERGAEILLPDPTRREMESVSEGTFWGGDSFAFVLMAGLIMSIAGILVGAFFAYDGDHILLDLFLGIFGAYAAQLVYLPSFIVFHCLIFGVLTFYATHLFAAFHYAFVPHPAAKNVPAANSPLTKSSLDEVGVL